MFWGRSRATAGHWPVPLAREQEVVASAALHVGRAGDREYCSCCCVSRLVPRPQHVEALRAYVGVGVDMREVHADERPCPGLLLTKFLLKKLTYSTCRSLLCFCANSEHSTLPFVRLSKILSPTVLLAQITIHVLLL